MPSSWEMCEELFLLNAQKKSVDKTLLIISVAP